MNDFTQMEHDACGIGTVVQIDGKPSYEVVDQALHIVEKLEHRAGKDATGEVGDGVGILLQISHRFFSKVCKKENIKIDGKREYGVGMFFFNQQSLKRNQANKLFETNKLLSQIQTDIDKTSNAAAKQRYKAFSKEIE